MVARGGGEGDRGLCLEAVAGEDRLGLDAEDVALQLVHELGADLLALLDRLGVARRLDIFVERLEHAEAALLERLDVIHDGAVVVGVCLAHFYAQLLRVFDDGD